MRGGAVDWHRETVSNAAIHGDAVFLPWHRWYIMTMENILREVTGNCKITVPYFDWTLAQHWPLSNSTLGMWDNQPGGLGAANGGSSPSPSPTGRSPSARAAA